MIQQSVEDTLNEHNAIDFTEVHFYNTDLFGTLFYHVSQTIQDDKLFFAVLTDCVLNAFEKFDSGSNKKKNSKLFFKKQVIPKISVKNIDAIYGYMDCKYLAIIKKCCIKYFSNKHKITM